MPMVRTWPVCESICLMNIESIMLCYDTQWHTNAHRYCSNIFLANWPVLSLLQCVPMWPRRPATTRNKLVWWLFWDLVGPLCILRVTKAYAFRHCDPWSGSKPIQIGQTNFIPTSSDLKKTAHSQDVCSFLRSFLFPLWNYWHFR